MSANLEKRRPRKAVAQGLTFSEARAAQKLDLSQRQLQRYRRDGLISYFRCGARVLYDDTCLLEFLQKHRQAAA